MKKCLFLHIAFNIVVVATVAVECCLVQSLLCRGVSNRDDKASTLLQALAVQINSTILGYEPVDVVTGGYHTSALCEDVRDF